MTLQGCPTIPKRASSISPPEFLFQSWTFRPFGIKSSDTASTSTTSLSLINVLPQRGGSPKTRDQTTNSTEETFDVPPYLAPIPISPSFQHAIQKIILEKPSLGSQMTVESPFSDEAHVCDEEPSGEVKTGYQWRMEPPRIAQKFRIEAKQEPPKQAKVRSEVRPEFRPEESHSAVQAIPVLLREKRLQVCEPTTTVAPLHIVTHEDDVEPKAIATTDKEGLYCRTKRALGLKHGPASKSQSSEGDQLSRSLTGDMLNRVTSELQVLPDTEPSTSSRASSFSNLSIAAIRPHRSRLWPTQRKSGPSTSSSIRSLLLGPPPVVTPDPEAMYTGADMEQFIRVEMCTPNAPTFLPSEARRVGTPPLPAEETRSGRFRGFFFDYDRPLDESPGGETPGTPKSPSAVNRSSQESDWFRSKIREDQGEDEFALNIPMHLPNSPLCPKHPKHPSGGKGVCVYHGRELTMSLKS
ncbi:hypothetical protein MMC12_002428 [Toensbergia leucococca]|nr:hypothetical protein [Toensbergia leucococca]